jgi:hypothetical protein
VTLGEFRATLADAEPPAVAPLLRALWHAGRGEWDHAHAIAQDDETEAGAWVHAYLHRQEGDISNAKYWYERARQTPATQSFSAEWNRIAAALLR